MTGSPRPAAGPGAAALVVGTSPAGSRPSTYERSGTSTATARGHHDAGEDEVRGALVAGCTDHGDVGVPLTRTARAVLEPTT